MDNLNIELIQTELQKFESSDEKSQLQTIKKMKSNLQESIDKREDYEDPDGILYKNIDRANRMLDILEEKIKDKSYYNEEEEDESGDPKKKKRKKSGDSLARLFEVTALLINTITTATNSITGSFKDDMEYQYKLELLEIEKQKLAIKYAVGGLKNIGGGSTESGTVTMNREELLELLKNEEGE